jgi:hypothetical protein
MIVRTIGLALIAAAGFAAVVLLRGAALVPDATPVPAVGTSAGEAARAVPAAILRLRLDDATGAELAQTVARPLFWESRRPQPPAPPPAAAQAPSPVDAGAPSDPGGSSDMRLAGILTLGARTRRALLVWPQSPAGEWLTEGAEIDGWRIRQIDRASVRLEAGGRQVELKLD